MKVAVIRSSTIVFALASAVHSWTTVQDAVRSRHSKHKSLVINQAAFWSRSTTSRRSASALAAADSSSEQSQTIYSMPALYDLAFGYRDFEEEVTFLLSTHRGLTGQEVRTVLELAAGPARHAMEALRRLDTVQSVTCIDNSKEMREYAIQMAAEELPTEAVQHFEYLTDDMRSFQLPDNKSYDAVWILLGSLQHMISNEEVITCFQSVAKVLDADGTVTLELPHPRETFSMAECTRNGWEIPLEDENGEEQGELKIIWGDDDDHFDPIKQVRQFTVAMELNGVTSSDNTDLQNIREIVPMRLFTAQEIDALARCAGLRVSALFGALEDGVSVQDEDAAFRLVAVLQKL